MKSFNKYIMALGLGCLVGFTSCSDSWLQTGSTQAAEGTDLYATTANMRLALNGICRTMVQQHSYYGQMFNGEGTIKLLYGEYMGETFNFPYMSPGWAPIMNGMSMITQSNSSIYDSYPWYYYYQLVNGANGIINRVDKAEGSQQEKDFLKAEALTIRAYSFLRLTDFYCEPWMRSDNGSSDGIVLRLKEVVEAGEDTDMPLSTLAKTYQQIYDDLDEAIRLFQSSGLTREEMYSDATSPISYPNEKVAHSVYARAALNKQDYKKALSEATLALGDSYTLMDNNMYCSGFANPNDEWVWGVYNDASETIWYFGWQLFLACNGYYASNGINVCINKQFIEQFPDNDIRKKLFITENNFLPEGSTFEEVISGSAYVNQFNVRTEKGQQAYKKANEYVKSIVPNAVEQNYAYASLKFQCTALPAVGCQPIIRNSELLLIQAEAAYYEDASGKQSQDALNKLNATSGRDNSYVCTKTGEELLKEIKNYRSLELWGEGFSWFDHKRWGEPIVRKSLKEGGNFHDAIKGTWGFDNGEYVSTFWKWILPGRETDYNSAINYK